MPQRWEYTTFDLAKPTKDIEILNQLGRSETG